MTGGPADPPVGIRPSEGDRVELSIPAGADLVVLARLTAATIASRANFDIEEIEDLRLAVDELCVSVGSTGGDGQIDLSFVLGTDQVEVFCDYLQKSEADLDRSGAASNDGLSSRILDALVDEHGLDVEGDRTRAWFRKRLARQQA